MSANIKRLSTFFDNRMISLDFQGNKLVCLSGAKENKDSILYTLERFFARDFSSYYDDIDKNLGVNYKNIEGSSTLQFTNGFLSYSDSKLQIRGTLPNIHCIRYSGKDRIRSFLISSEDKSECIGYNMTTFSSVISDNKWNRLVTLFNKLIGYEVVKLDMKIRKLSFDIHSFNDWSEDAIKFVYLIMSESMLTPDNYVRVTILSELSLLNSRQVNDVIKTLSSLSRNEVIFFSNTLSSDITGLNYKVLNLSV